MKKILSLLILVCISLVIQSGTPVNKVMVKDADKLLFTWYYDQAMTDPTGTTSTVAVELNRNRDLYPSYTWQSVPGIGLLPVVWGYYSPTITAQIYSNMW